MFIKKRIKTTRRQLLEVGEPYTLRPAVKRSFWRSRNSQCLSLPEYTSVHSPPCPHSWSNNFLFIAKPGGRIYNCCRRGPTMAAAKNLFATCNRWVGGEPGGNRTTIFGPAIKSWEVRHCLTWFLLFQASHSRKIPDRKGRRQNGGQFRPDV